MKIPINRVVVIVGILANLTAALVPVVSDLGWQQIAVPLGGVNAMLLMFLKGWQQWEAAEAKDLVHSRAVQREAAAQAEAIAQATKPRGYNAATSKLNLPR